MQQRNVLNLLHARASSLHARTNT